MEKRGDSRGLSKIVTIFMIVFIVFLIVIFFVIKDVVLKGSEDRTLGRYTLDLKISEAQVRANNSLLVVVKRNAGAGQFVGLNFIINNGSKKEQIAVNGSLDELGSKLFLLKLNLINVSKAKIVSLQPIFQYKSKKLSVGNIEDEYTLGSSGLSCIPYCVDGAQCGDNGCGGQCAGGCKQDGYICENITCIPDLETKCFGTIIKIWQVNHTDDNFTVTLSRQEGGEKMGGIKLVFTNNTEPFGFVADIPGNMTLYENITDGVTILDEYLTNPKNVQTVVYFLNDSGLEDFCTVSHKFLF